MQEFEVASMMEHRHDADVSVRQQPPRWVLPPPPRAPVLQYTGAEARLYWDRSHYSSPAAQMEALQSSASLYVGNLAFTTRTVHVRQHFGELGPVKKVILGLDRVKKTPCGFCFVEYFHRSQAIEAVSLLSGTKLDGRVIRVELDAGFQPGRQYGRGVSGGQVRDDVAKRNANNKRTRGSEDHREWSGTHHASSSAPQPLPVTLDGALPSARNQLKVEYNYGGPPQPAEEDNTKSEMDDAPAAKRQKRE